MFKCVCSAVLIMEAGDVKPRLVPGSGLRQANLASRHV